MSRILIVSKTKMANNRVCVGGIDMDNKISVRLLDKNGYHESANTCTFNIREIWDIKYQRHNQRSFPHSEDVCVTSKNKLGKQNGYVSMFDLLNKMQIHVYEGDILDTFENKLKRTYAGALYISMDSVPNNSTCFWICDKDIKRKDDNGKIRYNYSSGFRKEYNIPYVGLEKNPTQIIPQGTLVRLSLANWWAPEISDIEERCYLQLSGWY